MYKTLLITVITLLLITFGLSGCSQATAKAQAQDAPMSGHGLGNEEVLAGSSYDSGIDIDWPY